MVFEPYYFVKFDFNFINLQNLFVFIIHLAIKSTQFLKFFGLKLIFFKLRFSKFDFHFINFQNPFIITNFFVIKSWNYLKLFCFQIIISEILFSKLNFHLINHLNFTTITTYSYCLSKYCLIHLAIKSREFVKIFCFQTIIFEFLFSKFNFHFKNYPNLATWSHFLY